MKKTSIEMLLLLSNVYDRKNLSELNKDLRTLDAEAFDLLLARLEEQKVKILSAFADELEAQLERMRERMGTAEEVSYLLLTRYKLRVPDAAQGLARQLVHLGYPLALTGSPTKANFVKWLKQVCDEVPRDKVMDSALSLRPQ